MDADKATAIKAVESALNEERDAIDILEVGPIVVMDEYTIEKPYGWVFFFNTAKFVETKNRRFSLIGGGILVFEKSDSSMTILSSQLDRQEAIEQYEKSR